MQKILKSESFAKYKNIKIKSIMNENNNIENYNIKKIKTNNIDKKIINEKKLINNNLLNHQDYILDILLELRNFDEKNGTELFKNISYNNLNNFILKNTVL